MTGDDGDPIYFRVAPNGALPDFPAPPPSKVVVILDGEYSEEWQALCSRWIVDGGCRYMMAWGPDCSSWDDSVDYADLERFDFGEVPDSHFVMTTWHEKQTLEDAFWFSQFCAMLTMDDLEMPATVLLHIGDKDRSKEFLDVFKQSRSLADREPEDSKPRSWLRRLFGR